MQTILNEMEKKIEGDQEQPLQGYLKKQELLRIQSGADKIPIAGNPGLIGLLMVATPDENGETCRNARVKHSNSMLIIIGRTMKKTTDEK